MSIANELCSEVATAVMTRQEGESRMDPREMTKILLEVHATLRRLDTDERRTASPVDPKLNAFRSTNAASGNH